MSINSPWTAHMCTNMCTKSAVPASMLCRQVWLSGQCSTLLDSIHLLAAYSCEAALHVQFSARHRSRKRWCLQTNLVLACACTVFCIFRLSNLTFFFRLILASWWSLSSIFFRLILPPVDAPAAAGTKVEESHPPEPVQVNTSHCSR